jgi:4-alpha-glucanotransferase
MTMAANEIRQLRRLAALHRIQTSYLDMRGQRRYASPESLLGILQAVGASVDGLADVPEATRRRREELLARWVAPVIVAWDGDPGQLVIRLPLEPGTSHAIGARLQYTLHLESGDIWSGHLPVEPLPTQRFVRWGAGMAAVKSFMPPRRLPLGYHRLTVLIGTRAFQATVIAAPTRAYPHPDGRRRWGIFAPIYALRSARDWGAGDFADAEALVAWVGEQGGSLFGTLPFLSSYLDTPCDPSPYTPISRLFWNEFFVDVTRLPELGRSPAAQELAGAAEFRRGLEGLKHDRLVDYRSTMRMKSAALRVLAQEVAAAQGTRYEAVRYHAERHPELARYARFRAATARLGRVWTEWPENLRAGDIPDGSSDPGEEFYHQYVQLIADEQTEALAKRCATEGVELYLDYPLGTHPQGFDTWRYQGLFAHKATVGAPPDPVFTTGQDWGFHPLLPEAQRRDGYRYFAAGLRHQMRHAGILRIDHVMGLHRMYWIPRGAHKSEGVYVHSPAAELYAILTLESHRAQCALVGENLGIVPGYVNDGMTRHGLIGMNVAYWEIAADPEGALQRMAARPNTVASLNTHDMFPFAAFWHGLDADRRAELGMISADQADLERWLRGELRGRLTGYLREHGFAIDGEEDTDGALRGILTLLSRSRAEWVLLNLEDLWLETSPQNIPDTVNEHPNWRQKARYSIEEILRDERIAAILKLVRDARGGG